MEYKEGSYCDFFGTYGKVYSLSDNNGDVFYIGCTCQTMEMRMRGHMADAKRGLEMNRPAERVKKIIELNFEITATILAMKWVTGRDLKAALSKLRPIESEYIQKYLSLGYNLTNCERQRTFVERNSIAKESVGQSFKCINNRIIIEDAL